MWVVIVMCSALAVQCAPNFQLGGLSLPVPKAPGSNSDYDVKLTDQGLDVNRHHETHTATSDHAEQHTSTKTNMQDANSSHLTAEQSESSRVHDSSETVDQAQDSGFHLGARGLQLYQDSSSVQDSSATDTESGSNRTMSADKTANTTHYSASGSEYNRSSTSTDHHEEFQHKSLSLDGDFAKNMGSITPGNVGELVKGRGGLETSERRSLDTHEGGAAETGGEWSKTKDIEQDGNQTRIASTDNVSQHTNVSKESTRSQTLEKQTKHIDGETQSVSDKDAKKMGKCSKK